MWSSRVRDPGSRLLFRMSPEPLPCSLLTAKGFSFGAIIYDCKIYLRHSRYVLWSWYLAGHWFSLVPQTLWLQSAYRLEIISACSEGSGVMPIPFLSRKILRLLIVQENKSCDCWLVLIASQEVSIGSTSLRSMSSIFLLLPLFCGGF